MNKSRHRIADIVYKNYYFFFIFLNELKLKKKKKEKTVSFEMIYDKTILNNFLTLRSDRMLCSEMKASLLSDSRVFLLCLSPSISGWKPSVKAIPEVQEENWTQHQDGNMFDKSI